MDLDEKRRQYEALVAERKRCRACAGLRNPADGDLAALDADEIGPWTRLHGDLDASVVVVGQDWGDVRYYLDNKGLDNLRNPTTRTLEGLLRGAGLEVSLAEYGTGPGGLFLTNAILCLKDGGLQAPVDPAWFAACGPRFLRRQIEIVAPRAVVTLGKMALDAVCLAFGRPRRPLADAVGDAGGTVLPNGSVLLAAYHCGDRVLRTHRQLAAQQRVALVIANDGETSRGAGLEDRPG
jgi:uracil-DNA glycosylase